MAFLHETQTLESIRDRLSALGSDSPRRWVKMSIDQMPHVVKFLLLNTPWPRGLPTAPEWIVAGERFDFELEWSRCLTLLREIAARPLIGEWPRHAGLGDVGRTYHSRINAKHLDQHLKQFIA
jgi:hypothetical protein